MKKYLLLLIVFLQVGLAVQADSYLPWSSQINNRMFSPEETRPYMNLERTQYTNRAIMNIETKYSAQPASDSAKQGEEVPPAPKSKGLKSWFKGFVVEW